MSGSQGHAIARHQQLGAQGLAGRISNEIRRGKLVRTGFDGGKKASDQIQAVTLLLNSRIGQEALGILDYCTSEVGKRLGLSQKVVLTGPVDYFRDYSSGMIAVSGRKKQGVLTLDKPVTSEAQKITIVLGSPKSSFTGPLYIITAYPNVLRGEPLEAYCITPSWDAIRAKAGYG
ncbi:MAG: hypothetical protein GY750_18655 [Lentisphaerae bacterium]|nr:hypothetical protein [Lentisphaerota bacterium]MCP4103420.1 hypothetical protein [Lentisphaerota bacterium]